MTDVRPASTVPFEAARAYLLAAHAAFLAHPLKATSKTARTGHAQGAAFAATMAPDQGGLTPAENAADLLRFAAAITANTLMAHRILAPVAMVVQQDTHAVVETHQDGTPVVLHTADAESCEAWVRVRGRSGSDAFSLRVVPYSSAAMVAQPVQQAQAKARAPKPARGERRYVTVRDTETGETHRVLTSVARVGVAVVIFTPSNRHREGALGGMLITHDDRRKAWVFNDDAEARRLLACNRATGERVIRAELIADPA
ncbi:hypothetical protein [Methylobacterium sp. E-045]|uniref:hypothetical protein n=1 Tax=Methylobacterium sp. E-045 TaxID=2836575 RepID=UPI001FBB09CF|nr:hypothetical protein [Methylobacterium sp. E-045]MCJ2131589.1 hypothetical protein [Methylobacterium sp. E-045]